MGSNLNSLTSLHILLVKGTSKFNVLRRAADEIALGFQKAGHQVTVFDLESQNYSSSDLYEEIEKPYDFVFSCQAIGFETTLGNGVPLLRAINKPYIGWIFDDPLYHMPRIQNLSSNTAYLFTIDQQFPDVIKTLYPDSKNVFFLPHGGFPQANATLNNPLKEKDIDILFSGTITSKPVLSEQSFMPIEEYLATHALQRLESVPGLSVRTAMELTLQEAGESPTPELWKELSNVICYLDRVVRYTCKYNVLHTLLKNGLHIHIAGEGNEEFSHLYPGQVTTYGPLNIDDVISLIGRSKIVINPVPTLTQGLHERIVTAMLGHAFCFTPYSQYLYDNWRDCLNFINMRNLSETVTTIKEILKNYESYQTKLEHNYKKAVQEHTWEQRGIQIVKFYEGIASNHHPLF